MGKTTTDKPEPKAAADKPEPKKRTVLSPAERIAKLEADLKAAREKASGQALAKVKRLSEQRDALVSRRDDLNAKIEAVEAEIKAAEALANGSDDEDTEDAPEEDVA